MGRILKKVLLECIISIFLISSSFYISHAGTYLNTYYSKDKEVEISKGVTHISGKKLTNRGIINIEMIKVDLDNDDLKFENVFNEDVMGKKTTVNNLIKEKENVVAAINGDFFEMSLSPSFELGATINDGLLEKISSGEYYNFYSNSLASLIIDKEFNPYIDFITSNVTFSNDKDSLYISYYNKAGDKEGTVCFLGKYFTTSKSMDTRNPNTYKIVVEDDEIIDIIEPGETIDIKEEQYIIFLPVNFERIQNFEIGDEVTLDVELKFNEDISLDEIVTSIGGAGIFIENGKVVQNGYIISGATARSFMGYDSDKEYLYFGTVGGLTSVNSGLTSNQLGELLVDYGIYNAFHLDGGGSSVLVAKNEYNNEVAQVSDVKTQRAIINAFVVSNTAKVAKKVSGIKLDMPTNKAIIDTYMKYDIHAYDENHKEIENFNKKYEIESDKDISVDYKKKLIKFNEIGRTHLTLSCDDFVYETYVDVYDMLSEIQILPDPIVLEKGEEVSLNIIAFTGEKYKIPIDAVSCDYEINPPDIAEVKDGKVVGKENGVGTICVKYDDLEAYSVLSVGKEEIYLEKFNTLDMESVSYPESVKSDISNDNGKLEIEYTFEKSDETQAAYARYDENLKLPENASKIILDLKGDNKGCMLKIKLVDSSDNVYNMTVCNDIDFKNTKEFEVELPTGYIGNLYIERYYVVTLETKKKIKSSIIIDDVRCVVPLDYTKVSVPKSIIREYDSKNDSIKEIENKDFIFFNNGSKTSMLANYLDNEVYNKLLGLQDKHLILNRKTKRLDGIEINNGLNKYEIDNSLIISMSTIKGSAFDKDPYQYGQLENILEKSDAENIIIVLDGDLKSSTLAKDKAMLEYILTNYYEKRRVNYYIVMFTGTSVSDTTDNGIRYIKLPQTISNAYSKNVLIMRNIDEKLEYNFIDYKTFIEIPNEEIEEEKEETVND